jgi:cytochrome b
MSESRDETLRPVLIWDLPQRLFHWLLVFSFAGAWLSADSERWRLLHVSLGYTVGGLLLFRLAWGVFGSRHARFRAFVRGPAAVLAYLRSITGRSPQHATGHNPAGAVAIVALLALGLLTTASGWLIWSEWGGTLGGERLAEFHEFLAISMLALVGVHLAGVLIGSLVHRENLVRAMLSGRKLGQADEALPSARRGVAAILIVAVMGFWAWRWQFPPGPGDTLSTALSQVTPGNAAERDDLDHDDDDED